MHPQAREVKLRCSMPRQDATDRPDSTASTSSTSSPPVAAATMWEYDQARAAMQPSLTSWSPYAWINAALLDGSAFGADSSSAADMRLQVGEDVNHGRSWISFSQGELNSTGYRENFLDLLASKSVTPDMFNDVPGALTSRFEAASSDVSSTKYEITGSPLFLGSGTNAALHAQQGSMASFLQQRSGHSSAGLHARFLDYSGLGGLDEICHEGRATEAAASPFSLRSLPDFATSGGYRSITESALAAQPYMRGADLSDCSRQETEIMPAMTNSSGGGTASNRKKPPSKERKEGTAKKSKQEASTASPPKQQVPKVKLGEKITALQQMVSPFGKTDTASVLLETIKYIKFLHEQVQLLSQPYTSASRSKDISSNVYPWGGKAEASMGEGEHGLNDRGLCLVPVSWTPEVYQDGNAMDYWTPAYRGGLYR